MAELNEAALLAAKKGAFWLDEVCDKGWEQRIDLGTLSLPHGDQCIIGQLRPQGKDIGDLIEAHDNEWEWLLEHGFVSRWYDSVDPTPYNYNELDAAWRHLLNERLEA